MLILNSYLSYPDDQLANNHRFANKLGRLDLSAEERVKVCEKEEEGTVNKNHMKETKIIRAHSEVTFNLFRPVDAVASSSSKKTSVPASQSSKMSTTWELPLEFSSTPSSISVFSWLL